MLNKITISILWIFLLVGVAAFAATTALAVDVGRINKEALKALLGNDEVIVLDVRTGRDWSASEFKIQGARRVDANNIDTWSASLPKDKKLVLYCA